jgi:L-fuconolactonase
MSDGGVVDAHHHLWDLGVRDQDWITGEALASIRRDFLAADLEPLAAGAGVTKTVVVQTVLVAEETPELLAIAADSALISAVVGWLDLTAPDVADRVAELRALPGGGALAGIRHQVQLEPDPDWLVRPDVLAGLRALAEAGLVYDLVVQAHQLPACVRAAREVPGLTFVLDHLGKPPVASGALEPWATEVRALAEAPNTVCKLSGLVTEADWSGWTVDDLRPYADTVLDAFGPDRLMFGSDWPVSTLAADYARVLDTARKLTTGLGTAEQDAVFRGTASRVYGL